MRQASATSVTSSLPRDRSLSDFAEHTLTLGFSSDSLEELAARVADIVAARIELRFDVASPWLDVVAASEYIGVTGDALYKLTAARAIPCRKKAGGQGLRFHRDELDAWMEEHYPRIDRCAELSSSVSLRQPTAEGRA
jgi:excisionase family DNA binding protein